jgi:hypothetical protein
MEPVAVRHRRRHRLLGNRQTIFQIDVSIRGRIVASTASDIPCLPLHLDRNDSQPSDSCGGLEEGYRAPLAGCPTHRKASKVHVSVHRCESAIRSVLIVSTPSKTGLCLSHMEAWLPRSVEVQGLGGRRRTWRCGSGSRNRVVNLTAGESRERLTGTVSNQRANQFPNRWSEPPPLTVFCRATVEVSSICPRLP